MMKCITLVSLALIPANLAAQTSGRITGTVGDLAVAADVICNVGIWSEVSTLDDGDGKIDTDGDGFALKLSGGGGSVTFGMFANDLGFESGILAKFENDILVIDQPYHILHTGQRIPLDLFVDCAG